ncbi:hypothetical protein [Streptomyces sp. NBC_00878]|uniref:hypothetical protein n=1 Tax=Streptomyces sp. NBC_00878 TaxID=2975854 RepID=UPI0022558E1B|nr:hypothetical protein [Streptomyces sp. NBC_00878]MCX4909627.1 hypothetical protein [Streptomyces sp. NBC_00878]
MKLVQIIDFETERLEEMQLPQVVVPGRATPLQDGVHPIPFAASLELAVNP